MKVLYIDPPGGWLYGFPQIWDTEEYPSYKDLLRAKGYPEKDIALACEYSRSWYEEDGQCCKKETAE